MSELNLRIFGWSAYANGILVVANMVTLALMFAVNMAWGRVNDAVSVFWILSFLPLVVLLAQINEPVAGRGVAVGVGLFGAVGMLVFAWLQALLALGQVQFEQTLGAVITLGGILGVWLLLNGLLALKGETMPAGLSWLTVAYGLSYVAGAVGFWLAGYESPLLWVGAAAGYLIGPVWALWLGWLLLHGRLVSAEDLGGLP